MRNQVAKLKSRLVPFSEAALANGPGRARVLDLRAVLVRAKAYCSNGL